jgi:hypothetical protein
MQGVVWVRGGTEDFVDAGDKMVKGWWHGVVLCQRDEIIKIDVNVAKGWKQRACGYHCGRQVGVEEG